MRVKKKSGKSTSRVKRNRGNICSGKILVTAKFLVTFPRFFSPDKVVTRINRVVHHAEISVRCKSGAANKYRQRK